MLRMTWNGKTIVDLSREFLNSNGAEKHTNALIGKPEKVAAKKYAGFEEALKATASDLNVCSKRGLSEEFDSTIGAGTVLMPFGGKYELTPPQAMVNQVSVENGSTDACSFMKENPNVKITYEASEDITTDLAAKINTGTLPDIFMPTRVHN